MSGAGVSADLREYYFSADPDDNEVDTLELRHPLFLDEHGHVVAVRFVNRREDFAATLEVGAPMDGGQVVTFLAASFTVQLPESSDQGVPSVQIVVGNAARAAMPYLDIAATSTDPLYATVRAYLADDTSTPQFILDGLNISSVDAGVFDITANAGFEDFLNKPFPKTLYTARDFPGLDR